MSGKIYPICTQAGVKRDGTEYNGNYYIDAQWCRFQRGIPKKIGGYQQIIGGLPNIPTGIFVDPVNQNFNLYVGDQSSVKFLTMDQFGNQIAALQDRTPAGFIADVNNVWTFDVMFDTVSNANKLIVFAAPNLLDIQNNVNSPIYYGNTADALPLIPTGQSVSGGIVVLHPYLFMFGNDGFVSWSAVNNPTVVMDSARIASGKVVAGMQTRAGNGAPGGLLWTLDSLIKVTFTTVGNTPTFRFDTVTDQSSILSSRSIIEYDGLYFWCAIDRFVVYNGTVQEVPNQMNLNYFFQNLNYAQRQKIWATKVPEFGEIWWFYPDGDNTQNNRVVVYNKRENTWTDNAINRGDGYFEQVFADPVWSDSAPDINNQYSIWRHEIGTDKDIGGNLTAIQSYFETGDMAWAAIGPNGAWIGADRWVDLYRFEPDFLQTGDMTLIVNGREYARSPVQSSQPYVFTPNTTKIDLREQRREMTLRFESNVVGGNYEMGQCMMVMRIGDARQ